MNTMKVAAATEFKKPLEILERPVPEPGRGEVLIRVRACGVCHTDLHTIDGDWPDKPELPRVPGHEVVGEVAKLGEGVEDLEIGQRVGVAWLHHACGRCLNCLEGWETLCSSQSRTGYDVDGGYAEYVIGDASYIARLPDGLSYDQAAPLMCAGLTVFKGLTMTEARPGDWVVVSGIGGLGHLAVQYARAMGFKVIATDVDDLKLDLAARLGATMTINVRETEPVGFIQRQIGGAHAALVTAVSPAAFSQVIGMVRPRATIVLNGLPPGDFPLNIYDMVMRAITLRGSIVGTRSDLDRALKLAAQAKIEATVHTARLDDINGVLDKMLSASLQGRSVLVFD